MKVSSRRAFLKSLASTSFCGAGIGMQPLVFPASSHAAEPPLPPRTLTALDALAEEYLKKFNAPGLSVAFAHKGRLVYRKSFGVADRDRNEALTEDHRFRIASISKSITSVAVHRLIEDGKLKLDDKVFGSGGLLSRYRIRNDRSRLEAITIRHLLKHTCGGWDNVGSDPMYRYPGMSHDDLIEWVLKELPLEHEPGAKFAYSNFGYCLLGRVIERVARASYDKHVKKEVLARCGIKGMEIAGNTLKDRAAKEVVYYDQEGRDPYERNMRRMDANGGWLATPTDLLRFLVHVDGFPDTPDILKPETFAAMMTPSDANPRYASGWWVNDTPNYWHGGRLAGLSSLAVRTASGFCWVGFVNTQTAGLRTGLDRLLWSMARQLPAWVGGEEPGMTDEVDGAI